MKLSVQCVTDWMRMEGIFSSSASVCANFDVAFEEKQIQLLDFSSAQHVLKEIWKLNEDLQTEMLTLSWFWWTTRYKVSQGGVFILDKVVFLIRDQ